MDLFDGKTDPSVPEPPEATPRAAGAARDRSDAPLAERMRPRAIEEIVGQEALLGPGRPLRITIESDQVASLLLWGPPGSGKTTLARLIADRTRARFVSFSAVLSGIKEIREVMAAAERARAAGGPRTILFIDEIHRFNRAQQDAFLPHVEEGTIVLIGATTENPSFAVNAALLSRCAVHVLEPLAIDAMTALLRQALVDPRGLGAEAIRVDDADLRHLAALGGGDARRALNALETVARATAAAGPGRTIDRATLDAAQTRAALLYDREGEEHFNLISALIKSMRNSDADAAIYWLVRMIESGEDPLYLARRMIRFASEDIGNADPGALRLALAGRDAFESLGLPEGALALAQTAIYLAAAPKSNAVYEAYGRVVEDLKAGLTDPVPLAIRNAPTRLMRDLGYGAGYRSAHDDEAGTADLECLPERVRGRRYYRPRDAGHEKALADRLRAAAERRQRLSEARGGGRDGADEAGGAARTTSVPPRRPRG